MRALVVEDEPGIAAFLARGLNAEGFAVQVAGDGARALELLRVADFDIVILDLLLPEVAGEDVLRGIRGSGSDVPVIVLTAKDAVGDRVANLEAGADDYLVKPFSFAELVARIRLRLRPNGGRRGGGRAVAEPACLTGGGIVLDIRLRRAERRGRVAELTAREFAVLEALLRHPGHVLSQQQLLDLAWGYDRDPRSNVVEVTVRRLRRKLGLAAVETVRGVGYRIRLDR